jgi:hypothetical protein
MPALIPYSDEMKAESRLVTRRLHALTAPSRQATG